MCNKTKDAFQYSRQQVAPQTIPEVLLWVISCMEFSERPVLRKLKKEFACQEN